MKLKDIITVALLFFGVFCMQSQNIEVTHQSDGTNTMVPLQSIDSVSFNLNSSPQTRIIYQNNSNVISKNLAEIDSITYQTNSIISEYAPTIFFCGAPTEIIDVVNPITGKTWMDRNLGASQVATSSTDELAYGDLYQWGRGADGHQCRNSATTTTLSTSNQPGHGDFILAPNEPNDWRNPQNTNLWQGSDGVNNPCPNGYRLPTQSEFEVELQSWSANNPEEGAFASALKLPRAGFRSMDDGSIVNFGSYWSSTVIGDGSQVLFFNNFAVNDVFTASHAQGMSVRCIKDMPGEIGSLECDDLSLNGFVSVDSPPIDVSVEIPYTDGNGGSLEAATFSSTGVEGLTASFSTLGLAVGSGKIVLQIQGNPNSIGTATFDIEVFGLTCSLEIEVFEDVFDMVKTYLTGNNSKTWMVDSSEAGHLGVGDLNVFVPNFFSAEPNAIADCLYDDSITFTLEANNEITFQHDNNSETLVNGQFTHLFENEDSTDDICLLVDTSGIKNINLAFSAFNTPDFFTTGTQFSISDEGFMSYFTNTSTYEVLEISNTHLYLRFLALYDNDLTLAWYIRFTAP